MNFLGPSIRLSEKLAAKKKVAEESDAKESLPPPEDEHCKLPAVSDGFNFNRSSFIWQGFW